jgi:MFS family permease
VRPPRALLVLGAAAFCTLLAEGSAADWSAPYLLQAVHTPAAVAALGYAAFSLAMATSRTLGDSLCSRFGPVTLARAGGAVAASGVSPALVVGSEPVALAGFAAMGSGLGVIVPLLFRAAAAAPGVSASVGVAAASTIGWLGFLAGPPAIGFAAGAIGLRGALAIIVAMVSLVVLAGGAMPRTGDAPASMSSLPGGRQNVGHGGTAGELRHGSALTRPTRRHHAIKSRSGDAPLSCQARTRERLEHISKLREKKIECRPDELVHGSAVTDQLCPRGSTLVTVDEEAGQSAGVGVA